MHHLIAMLLILALGSGSLPAGDITLTAIDNRDGTLTISIASYSGYPPVGIALKLDPNSEPMVALNRGQPYYDMITTIDPVSSVITSFAALATLSANDTFPDQVPNLFIIDFAGPATGMIEEDILRGGIVDDQGMAMGVNLPLAFTVTYCSCYGDVTDTIEIPGGDGIVTFGDLNYIVSEAAANGFTIDPVPAHLVCADLADSLQKPGPDGVIDFGDINYMISQISPLGFDSPCLTLP